MIDRHTIMDLQRLDPDGVPSIIQYLWFEYRLMLWKAILFNGMQVTIFAEHVTPYLPITQHQPTDLQRTQAFESITGLLQAHTRDFIAHRYEALP